MTDGGQGSADAQQETNAPCPHPQTIGDCPICGGTTVHTCDVARAGRMSICGTCGGWYRVPRPTLDDLARIYREQYYDSWGLRTDESIARLSKEATFKVLLDAVERRMAPTNGSPRLLDVGAATGALPEVARSRGWEVFAVELNSFASNVLRERFGAQHVFQGQLAEAGWADETFHCVTMTDFIEHVLDVEGTLRAAARLLRPGGILCLTTPCVDSWSRRLQRHQWLHFKEEHVQLFSRRGLRDGLARAGFAEIDIQPMWKRLSFDYLAIQLQAYRHWLLSPLITRVSGLLPATWRRHPLPYRCGEVRVLAVKSPGPRQRVPSRCSCDIEHDG